MPGSDGTNTDEGGFLQSLREPLLPLIGTPPTTPMVAVISPPLGVHNSGGRESTPVTLVSPAATEGVVTDEMGPDLSREGPFDACDADHDPGQSPMVLDSMSGYQYRITSYEERVSVSDLDPSYGIHLHDPRMMEYMGHQNQPVCWAGRRNTGLSTWVVKEQYRQRFVCTIMQA